MLNSSTTYYDLLCGSVGGIRGKKDALDLTSYGSTSDVFTMLYRAFCSLIGIDEIPLKRYEAIDNNKK